MKRTCRIASLSKTSLRTIDFVRSSFPISWHILKWNVDFVGIDNCALWHLPLPVVYHITCSWLSYFDTILLYIMYSCFYFNCCMCSTELLTADSLGLSKEIMLWFSFGSSGKILRKPGGCWSSKSLIFERNGYGKDLVSCTQWKAIQSWSGQVFVLRRRCRCKLMSESIADFFLTQPCILGLCCGLRFLQILWDVNRGFA